GILAHRRYHDAVAQYQRAQFDRVQQHARTPAETHHVVAQVSPFNGRAYKLPRSLSGIPMSKGTHDYTPDARNAAIRINLNGELVAREAAKVSVFDAGYVLGDGVWEGLRVHDGGKAIDMDIGLTREQLTQRIVETLRANGMREHVHIRLMVTRGIKATPHQDPRFVI